MPVETKWHGAVFKNLCHNNAKDILMNIGFQVEAKAKLNITKSVYNRPQRGRYIRTGAARSSIHTEYVAKEMACYIGSDEESLKNVAMTEFARLYQFKRKGKRVIQKLGQLARVAVGSSVFYFRFLEDGFHTRNGRFISGHHILKNALDSVKAKLK